MSDRYSLVIGRFQPFHDGHKALIQKLLDEGKQVMVAIMDTEQDWDNPFTYEQRRKQIFDAMGPDVRITKIPPIAEVCYGRTPGYKVRQVHHNKQHIRATAIRARSRECQSEVATEPPPPGPEDCYESQILESDLDLLNKPKQKSPKTKIAMSEEDISATGIRREKDLTVKAGALCDCDSVGRLQTDLQSWAETGEVTSDDDDIGDTEIHDRFDIVLGNDFARGWHYWADTVHVTSRVQGFWEQGGQRPYDNIFAQLHSEISEARECLREGNPPDKNIKDMSGAEVQLADVLIMLMDIAKGYGFNLAEAALKKIQFNKGRGFKHGKDF